MNCYFATTELATTETYFATSGKLTIVSYRRLVISFLNAVVALLRCRIIFHELLVCHFIS